jgi:ABC-type transport system involved in multi-copper enzyme maturation permease subunit
MRQAQQRRPRPPRFFSWRTLSALALLLCGCAVLYYLRSLLTFGERLTAGALLAAAILFLLWPYARYLFGPILFYDLVVSARRGRYVLIRCLYVAALMVILFLLYGKWLGLRGGGVLGPGTLARNDLAAFNEEFFERFMAVQYAVIVLLTPGVTAGAIAEEKERRTLEYLMATDLFNHEIVLGKLASRLAYLTLILLTGLPVLSLLQLLGGIEPDLMLAGFAMTALTMFSLAALSLLNSVYATRVRTAIALTYVQAAAYIGLTTLCLWLWGAGKVPFPLRELCAGNIYVALTELLASGMLRRPGGAGTLVAGLPAVLRSYAVFHLLVGGICLFGATVGLRLWARWQASGKTRRAFVIALTQKRLPRVGPRPMLWKETHAEPLIRLGKAAMILITTFVAGLIILGAFVMLALFLWGWWTDRLAESVNVGVRTLGTCLACLMLLGVALRASGAIGGERDRQTLDSLLVTPLEDDTIVMSKWWGSLLSTRKAGYFLLALGVLGVATGGLSILALLLLSMAWAGYAAFVAGLGLWLSLVCRTTLRATIWTVAITLGVSLGHWLLTFCCGPVFLLARTASPTQPSRESVTTLADFQTYALTPPCSLYWLAFSHTELTQGLGELNPYTRQYDEEVGKPVMRLTFCLIGAAGYGITGMCLLLLTRSRFRMMTGRMPVAGVLRRAPPHPRRARAEARKPRTAPE